jgi:hypothetical protein
MAASGVAAGCASALANLELQQRPDPGFSARLRKAEESCQSEKDQLFSSHPSSSSSSSSRFTHVINMMFSSSSAFLARLSSILAASGCPLFEAIVAITLAIRGRKSERGSVRAKIRIIMRMTTEPGEVGAEYGRNSALLVRNAEA